MVKYWIDRLFYKRKYFLIYDPLYDGSYQLKAYGENDENNLSQVAATNFILMGMEVPDDLAPPLFL